MSKERYNQIIDEVYETYCEAYEKDNSLGRLLLIKRTDGKSTYRKIDKDTFIVLCTQDKSFSEKWGLKIEERKLSLEERGFLANSNHYEVSQNIKMFVRVDSDHTLHEYLDDKDIPTKQITLTYQDESIQFYE